MVTRIGIVLCRVAAAVLIVQTIRSLGYTIPALFNGLGEFGADVLLFLVMTFVPGLAAIGLWIFAERICALPGRVASESEAIPSRSIDFLLIGTSLIGLYLVISGLLDGVNIEVTHWYKSDLGDEYKAMLDKERARIIGYRASYIAQIILGAAMIVGKAQVSRFLLRARSAGTGAS